MPSWAINILLTLATLGIAYALISEGVWGAVLVTFNVLFAALIAMNFYEPLAGLLAEKVDALAGWADLICLGGLFLVTLVGLKVATENLAPTMPRLPGILETLGKLVFGLAGAVLTVGFLVILLNTAPIHKRMLGHIDAEFQPPWGWGFDHKVLDGYRYITGKPFATFWDADDQPDADYGAVNAFPGAATWLSAHDAARPVDNTEAKLSVEAGGRQE
jgi:hypothetical protein